MYEWLLKFQDGALALDPGTLMIPGLIAIVVGLFLWLGGTRYSSFVAGGIGGALGAIGGLLFSSWFGGHTALAVVSGAAVLALLAVFFKRIIIILLAASIFALVAGSSYLNYTSNTEPWRQKLSEIKQKALAAGADEAARRAEDEDPLVRQYQRQRQAQDKTPQEQGREKLRTAWTEMQYLAASNRGKLIAFAAVGALIGLLLGWLLLRIMMAFCYSLVGATALLLGIFSLLIAKGTHVVDSLQTRPRVLPIIFLAMVLFGWMVQMLIAQPARKEAEQKET